MEDSREAVDRLPELGQQVFPMQDTEQLAVLSVDKSQLENAI